MHIRKRPGKKGVRWQAIVKHGGQVYRETRDTREEAVDWAQGLELGLPRSKVPEIQNTVKRTGDSPFWQSGCDRGRVLSMAATWFSVFHDALVELRNRAGLTQSEAAEAVQKSLRSMLDHEGGKTWPSRETLASLLEAYGATFHDLADLLEPEEAARRRFSARTDLEGDDDKALSLPWRLYLSQKQLKESQDLHSEVMQEYLQAVLEKEAREVMEGKGKDGPFRE